MDVVQIFSGLRPCQHRNTKCLANKLLGQLAGYTGKVQLWVLNNFLSWAGTTWM